MINCIDNKKYAHIIKDDISSYIWLWAAEIPTANAAAQPFCACIGAFVLLNGS